MAKSIGVVLGSYVVCVILVFATDPLLSRVFPGDFEKGRIPSNLALFVSTALFVVVSTGCAWLCARFAPSRPPRHVLWFFVLGEVMGIASTIGNWNNGWPHWYFLSWLLTWPASCWIGMLLRRQRSTEPSAQPASTR